MTSSAQQLDRTDDMIDQEEEETTVHLSVPGTIETANSAINNTASTSNGTTNSSSTVAASATLTRPNRIKPTRKKRKATTVLAVGASREKDLSLVTTATASSKADTSTLTNRAVGVTTDESHTNRSLTDNTMSNYDSTNVLLQQQQPQPPTDKLLRPVNSDMPLELIPPIIPENNTGKPSLRMFCSNYPKPKKPRRTISLRSATTGTSNTAITTTGAAANGTNNHRIESTDMIDAMTSPWTDPSQPPPPLSAAGPSLPHVTTETNRMGNPQQQPHHAGPVVQIVNGEIVLQESSMVFHGSVATGGNINSLMGGMGADASHYGNTGFDGINHFNHDYNNNNTNTAVMTVVEEEAEMAVVGATYTSFATGRRARPKVSHWTVEETQLFYEALQQVGLDFGTMEAYFEAAASNNNNDNNSKNNNIRFRQRRQLKRKYQAEYNKNPQLIEKALQCQGRIGIDLSVFHLSEEIVHNSNVQESSESRLDDIRHHDGTTSDERNDADTVGLTHDATFHQLPDHDKHVDSTTNDENNHDSDVVVDHDLVSKHHSTSTQRANLPDATATANPTHSNHHLNRPPKIVSKAKLIRPLRSAAAATTTMKQKKNMVK